MGGVSSLSAQRKVAIVIGAGGGVGKVVALGLLEAGFNVSLAGAKIRPLKGTATASRAPIGSALPIVTNVSNPRSVNELFARTVEAFSRVDILFNNLAADVSVSIDEMSCSQWQKVIGFNLTGAFLCTQAALRQMKSQNPTGGRIINNGSIVTKMPWSDSPAYAATKHALIGLTKSAAESGRPHGIVCSQIDVADSLSTFANEASRSMKHTDMRLLASPTGLTAQVARLVLSAAARPFGEQSQILSIVATVIGRYPADSEWSQ